MPQKKNADSLELIRGKSGRIFGRVSYIIIERSVCTTFRVICPLNQLKILLFPTHLTIFWCSYIGINLDIVLPYKLRLKTHNLISNT